MRKKRKKKKAASKKKQHISIEPSIRWEITQGQSDDVIHEQIEEFKACLRSIVRNQSNIL